MEERSGPSHKGCRNESEMEESAGSRSGPSHKGCRNESEMEESAGSRSGPSHKGCRNESEMEESAGSRSGPSHKGCRIQSYTFAFKLNVIQYAKDHNNAQASKKFNVGRSRVIDWRRNEAALRESGEGGKRMSGSGTKVTCLFIEERLKEWVNHMRDTGTRFTGSDLKKECLRLHQQVGNDYFKASCGWLRSFMKRNRLPSSRQATNVSQSVQEVLTFRYFGNLSTMVRFMFLTKDRSMWFLRSLLFVGCLDSFLFEKQTGVVLHWLTDTKFV